MLAFGALVNYSQFFEKVRKMIRSICVQRRASSEKEAQLSWNPKICRKNTVLCCYKWGKCQRRHGKMLKPWTTAEPKTATSDFQTAVTPNRCIVQDTNNLAKDCGIQGQNQEKENKNTPIWISYFRKKIFDGRSLFLFRHSSFFVDEDEKEKGRKLNW